MARTSRSALFPLQLRSRRTALLFGKTVGAFTDLLQGPFKLLQFHWRDVLEGASDECGVPAKEWNKHLPSFFSQRHRSHPAIGTALDPADKPLLVQAIHR